VVTIPLTLSAGADSRFRVRARESDIGADGAARCRTIRTTMTAPTPMTMPTPNATITVTRP
jgi:hypothetical protein